MASLTLRIPDTLEQKIAHECEMRGISKSDIAREALEEHLRVQAWRRLRDRVRPLLQAQGIFTEADVFKRLGEEL